MKLSIFVLTALLLNPLLARSQNRPTGDQANDLHQKRTTITGCLTKNSLKEFELVDEAGIDNLPYSATVNLDQYVGQIVTLIGVRAATPTSDIGPPKPHFMVNKVQSASGQCKK